MTTVLTIDDSPTVQKVYQQIFRGFRIDHLSAMNGVQGVSLARQHKPALICLDMEMPMMDGAETLSYLRTHSDTKHCPVLIVSSLRRKSAIMKVARLGIRDYVFKPFEKEALLEKIGRIIPLVSIGEEEKAKIKARSAINIRQIPLKVGLATSSLKLLNQANAETSETHWSIEGCGESPGSVLDFVLLVKPDVLMIDFELENRAIREILRLLRTFSRNDESFQICTLGLAPSNHPAIQGQMIPEGINGFAANPIAIDNLENAFKAEFFSRKDILEPSLAG